MEAALVSVARQRAAALIGSCSLEISPRDDLSDEALRALLPPRATIFVNHAASVTHHDIVAACVRLHRAGFVPVPHVAARRLTSFTQAHDFLQRVATEARVDRVLLIGGDDSPVGPFRSTLDLLATGVVERTGLSKVVFAGYPDGHPAIDPATLDAALRAKATLARRSGLGVSLVTQFSFEAQPILRWVAAQRAAGIECPVEVGIAGPASVATLAKYAIRCGVGASMRVLARGHTAFARIMVEAGPDGLISDLVAGETTDAPIAGLHVFTFGGIRRTAEWIRSAGAL